MSNYSENNNGNNSNNNPKIYPPISERDVIRQLLELELASVIGAFEANEGIAVHAVDIERLDRDERGGWTDLSRYPLREDPHPPLGKVRIEFAEGPLVSATPVLTYNRDLLDQIIKIEPQETIEEAALRMAKESDVELELIKTEEEAHQYGGRYA